MAISHRSSASLNDKPTNKFGIMSGYNAMGRAAVKMNL